MKFSDFNLNKCSDGLLPVIIQDAATLKVLMLGYMNEEAFNKTLESGKVTFFSRSRNSLWLKGETSGNFLDVEEMYPDCDADTLLIKVRPYGPVCHRNTTACFDTPESEGFLHKLEKIVKQRHETMPENSYTTRLFIKGVKKISQKVCEEAVEAAIEAVDGNRDRYLYEVADMLYHLTVLNQQMGISYSEIEDELLHRH